MIYITTNYFLDELPKCVSIIYDHSFDFFMVNIS